MIRKTIPLLILSVLAGCQTTNTNQAKLDSSEPEYQTEAVTELAPQDSQPMAANGNVYIAPGAFAHGNLIAGVDVQTLELGKQELYPVAIKLTDTSPMGEAFAEVFSSCRIYASAAGHKDIQRAYFRLERMNCLRKDGAAIDVPVYGWVADTTGKGGVAGKPGTFLGQKLADKAKQRQSQIKAKEKDFDRASEATLLNGYSALANFYSENARAKFQVVVVEPQVPVDVIFAVGFTVPGVN
jgi:hypothetical protein